VKGTVVYIVTLVVVALFASIGVAVALFVGGFGVVLGAFFALVGLAVMGNGLRHLIARSAFEQVHLEALGPVPQGAPRRCFWC
jgi:positive regulator of sigma E activity